ncbi:E3 ubiquitin-protein ligase TRIM45-like [Saccostrea cucullata]|uniref:E3 ubiquitin-protein ligase TRIM45-like n=1 Tax=Saccostrea cuccullata TaxID=36930 RepID=UPI002ED624E1
MVSGLSTQSFQYQGDRSKWGVRLVCKVRQCSECQGDTKFYCYTCKHDLCLQCKEEHAIDLDTVYHDVVIYSEKNKYISKQDTCARHPKKICTMFCHSCKLPVCSHCKEHKYHQIHVKDIRKTCQEKGHQHRKILNNIRSEALFYSCILLKDIRIDMKILNTEIFKLRSEMPRKAQKLKDCIDAAIFDIEIGLTINKLQKQKRKISRKRIIFENYEQTCEQSASRPVQFLLYQKNVRIPKINNLTHSSPSFFTEKINLEEVIKTLSEIKFLETGKKQVRNECFLKLQTQVTQIYNSGHGKRL